MGKNQHSSIYVTEECKQRLIASAKMSGFDVRKGRGSKLIKYLEKLLDERDALFGSEAKTVPFERLTPELQSTIVELMDLGIPRQNLANELLRVIIREGLENTTEVEMR